MASAPTVTPSSRTGPPVAVLLLAVVAASSAALLASSISGELMFAAVAGLVLGLSSLASPVFATVLLLVTMFLRLPIRSAATFPVELFLMVFVGLVVTTVLWMDRTPDRVRGIGAVECAMAAYLVWNIYSMVAAHDYAAVDPLSDQALPVSRFIVISALLPFTSYVIGRYIFARTSSVRALLWTVMALAGYSAAVSIMPFVGLSELVWPRYIVTMVRPSWAGRAVGIFNQPVVNGMVLALGFAIAMVVASRRTEPVWQRRVACVVAGACGVGIYFTHTRAAWLSALAVLVIGALLAKGSRQGFITILVLLISVVAINWSTFTSADREVGGVGSGVEVESRLNDLQTAIWAFRQKPLEGWGIGRFQSVNTQHHQQWAPDVPWSSGVGEVSHENELAILAELGLIGLAAWLAVLAMIAHRAWTAYRTLPDHDMCGKPIAVIAIMAIAILICAGMTVDLRYFDFPIVTVFLLFGVAVGRSEYPVREPIPVSDAVSGRGGKRIGANQIERLRGEPAR